MDSREIEIFIEDLEPNPEQLTKISIDDFLNLCEKIKTKLYDESMRPVLKAINRKSEEARNISGSYQSKFNRFFNNYYNEMIPLSLYLREKVKDKNVLVSYTGATNKSYDAILHIGEADKKIEITKVIDGEVNPVFNEHIKKFGYAPGFSELIGSIATCDKKRGIEEQNGRVNSIAGYLINLKYKIRKTVENKLKKNYEKYYLVVYFFYPFLPDDELILNSVLDALVSELKESLTEKFVEIIFIAHTIVDGQNIVYLREYDLEKF